jgi:hypothetical protein
MACFLRRGCNYLYANQRYGFFVEGERSGILVPTPTDIGQNAKLLIDTRAVYHFLRFREVSS